MNSDGKIVSDGTEADDAMEAAGTFNMTAATPDNWEGFFKARKRPVVIDALKVDLPEGFHVDTKEGRMTGRPGDYLLIGVLGEPYPCAAEIFEATYDVVDPPTS